MPRTYTPPVANPDDGTVTLDRRDVAVLEQAATRQLTVVRKKHDALSRRPVGRNFMARDRQLDALADEALRLSTLVVQLRDVLYRDLTRELTGGTTR